mgnify:CR=1 FL=1|tara:strand:- start:1970 stop:2323 length:354 start_codon:yes stop_codon:yes gene_type:complete
MKIPNVRRVHSLVKIRDRNCTDIWEQENEGDREKNRGLDQPCKVGSRIAEGDEGSGVDEQVQRTGFSHIRTTVRMAHPVSCEHHESLLGQRMLIFVLSHYPKGTFTKTRPIFTAKVV